MRANNVQSGSNGGHLAAAYNPRKIPTKHCLDGVRAKARFGLAFLHADGGITTVQLDAYRTDRSRSCHGLQLEEGYARAVCLLPADSRPRHLAQPFMLGVEHDVALGAHTEVS